MGKFNFSQLSAKDFQGITYTLRATEGIFILDLIYLTGGNGRRLGDTAKP